MIGFGGESINTQNQDGFATGFIAYHNHSWIDYTSLDDEHVHQYMNISHPAVKNTAGHIHFINGFVLYDDGHYHYYEGWSGPAIPVGDGMHSHYYDLFTTVNNNHRHHISGVNNPAIGN